MTVGPPFGMLDVAMLCAGRRAGIHAARTILRTFTRVEAKNPPLQRRQMLHFWARSQYLGCGDGRPGQYPYCHHGKGDGSHQCLVPAPGLGYLPLCSPDCEVAMLVRYSGRGIPRSLGGGGGHCPPMSRSWMAVLGLRHDPLYSTTGNTMALAGSVRHRSGSEARSYARAPPS